MAKPLIGIVGPCSAGKSVLARRLRADGYPVREIRQEHSVTPTMWQRITDPDILVYLDVSMEVAAQREGLAEPSSWWQEEREFRLAHARQHCDFYLDTSVESPEAVYSQVSAFLQIWELSHAEAPGRAENRRRVEFFQMTIPCFSFVGRSGVGKTMVLERLTALLKQRGYRVAVVKHTRHADIETDAPGKDTRRFWDAGAAQTVLVTPDRVIRTTRVVEPSTTAIAATVRDVDVILVEGDKYGPLPKIEVVRAACATALLPDVTGRIAVVTDAPDPAWGLPCFALEDGAALAEFIQGRIAAAMEPAGGWEELDHTADLALWVWAPDLPGLFAAAARGMFALMADVSRVPLARAVTLSLSAMDQETLLVDWLNELLYLSESGAEQWAYVAFRFDALTETTLQATAFGGLAPERLNAVKAATFHDLVIRAVASGFETKLVFDT